MLAPETFKCFISMLVYYRISSIDLHQTSISEHWLLFQNDICRFVPAKFEQIFQKHAHTHPNALTSDELDEMLKANREPNDSPGW